MIDAEAYRHAAGGDRVLTAAIRYGPWQEWDGEKHADRHGTYWTVIDRDTGEQIGSFGFPVEMATREQALQEAERFGSKWDWPTDRG